MSTPLIARAATDGLTFQLPETIEVESGIETAMPIEIRRRDKMPDQVMLLLRGIPPSVVLSQGRRFASGVWVVNASAIRRLRMIAKLDGQRVSLVTVSLVTLEGEKLAETSSRLVIHAPENVAASQNVPDETTESRVVTLRATPPASGTGNQDAHFLRPHLDNGKKSLILIERGDQNFAEGKISAARLFYQKAAELGSAKAALAVGKTYDPSELRGLPIVGGVEGDIELAKKWYEKARDMGAPEAQTMLQKFNQF